VPPKRGVSRGSAGETLEASVECRPTELQDVASPRRAATGFDVPVYREPPSPDRLRRSGAQEQPPPAADEQQQQQ